MNVIIPKISVIIPAYEAEKYISKCLDSFLKQSFRDYEILIVNDGSTDKTGCICDDYAVRDSRIRVFHKENGGVSSARQLGVDNAIGEYVIHADPDDWVEPVFLEEMYNLALLDNADVVMCDFVMDYMFSGQSIYMKQCPTSLDCMDILKDMLESRIHGSCWNKLVKRECINRYHIKFPLEISFTEDLYFNLSLFKHCIRVAYIPKAFYHYVQDVNINSIVKHYSIKEYNKDLIKITLFNDLFRGHEFSTLCEMLVISHLVGRAFTGNIFSNSEFKDYMGRYSSVIINNKSLSWHLRYRLFFSCIGYYSICFFIYKLIKQLLGIFRNH